MFTSPVGTNEPARMVPPKVAVAVPYVIVGAARFENVGWATLVSEKLVEPTPVEAVTA